MTEDVDKKKKTPETETKPNEPVQETELRDEESDADFDEDDVEEEEEIWDDEENVIVVKKNKLKRNIEEGS